MMSPSRPASVIGAGSGICTFCAEWERWLILCCCKAILSRNYHHLTVRDTRVLTLHSSQCGQYQFHSVQSDTWLQLLRQLTAVPSSGQLSQLSGPRLSHRQQLCSLSNSATANFSSRQRWMWPGLHGTAMSAPGCDHLMCHCVTGVAGGVGWCPPPVSVSFPPCCSPLSGHCSWLVRGQSTPSHGGETEWAETGHWSRCPHPVSQTIRPPGPGPDWQEYCQSESVGYKKDTACVPVPRIITGPRGDSPLAGSDHDWEPQDSSWRNRLTAARARKDRSISRYLVTQGIGHKQTNTERREGSEEILWKLTSRYENRTLMRFCQDKNWQVVSNWQLWWHQPDTNKARTRRENGRVMQLAEVCQ